MPSITVKFTASYAIDLISFNAACSQLAMKFIEPKWDGETVSHEIIEVIGQYGKTPKRTLYWSHICSWVAKQVEREMNDEKFCRDVVSYCMDMRDKADREGYDDSAQYLQHIVNDLSK